MAKIVYICPRASADSDQWAQSLENVSKRLSPDNIDASCLIDGDADGIRYAVVTPPSFLLRKGASVAVGALANPAADWSEPEATVPDGTYALFRANSRVVELCSDAVASRTIWYYQGEQVFLASTSQRAIIMLLRSYEPNDGVTSWVLSAGCLPPTESWDRRITSIPPSSRLRLDRQTWSISVETTPAVFAPKALTSEAAASEQLESLLRSNMGGYQFDAKHWLVPLSGGYDSRGLLLFMGEGHNLHTLTWGQASSMGRPGNDATVARDLARELGLEHTYETTDASSESSEVILDRFLRLGEGRVDHVTGYLDGFAIWRRLVELGFEGVIRGDEGFGWQDCATEDQARATVGMEWLSDFGNLQPYQEGFPAQSMPEYLSRRADETLPVWRDRLYHGFRIPTILAALTDLKVGYVEIANPYLSRAVIDYVRTLPDELRTNKILYRRVIERLTPPIPFATEAAIADMRGAMSSSAMKMLLADGLASTESAHSAVPIELRNSVRQALVAAPSGEAAGASLLRSLASRWVPRRAKALLRKTVAKRTVDPHTLAFRIYLLDRMQQILAEDASSLQDRRVPT